MGLMYMLLTVMKQLQLVGVGKIQLKYLMDLTMVVLIKKLIWPQIEILVAENYGLRQY